MLMRQEDLVNTESREEGFITNQYTDKTETHSTEQILRLFCERISF